LTRLFGDVTLGSFKPADVLQQRNELLGIVNGSRA
jgi:hypothetical protein